MFVNGFDLIEVQYGREQRGMVLRLFIDRPEGNSVAGGINVDDCERVSHSLGALLDQADPLPGRYTLEVSSPGAERPLRTLEEYRRFLGR